MPWLVGTALIHSLAVTEKRGALPQLDGAARDRRLRALSLLGTFLVRSGVLTSVHAFAVDPKRGVFILVLARALHRRRAGAVRLAHLAHRAGRRASRRSRANRLLLANNVLLAAAAGTVFLGTLYPLALDALGAGKISVGPPYFETVFVPLMAPALFLMGVGPLARWKRVEPARARGAAALGARREPGARLLLPFAFGDWSALVGFGLALAIWIVLSALLSSEKSLAADPRRTTAWCSRTSASRCSWSA